MKEVHTLEMLGVRVNSQPFSYFMDIMRDAIENGQRGYISYTNVHAINMAQDDPRFMRLLNHDAASTFCDGMGVHLGARLMGYKLPHRFTMPDEIDNLCAMCVEQDYSIYCIGGRDDVSARAAAILQERHPGLRVAGTHHGWFDKDPDSDENRAVIEAINAAQPDILLVAFGMPRQEYWTQDNWEALTVPTALMVGALYDYLTGDLYRAPRWVTDNGLEWLARLVMEPRRLFKRYVVGNPLFIWRILTRPRQRVNAQTSREA